MKTKEFLRRIFECFTPGGTYRTEDGVRIRISNNGTSSIEPEDMEKYLDAARKKWSEPPSGSP